MDDTQRRRAFQRLKALSHDRFWEQMNIWHSAAYNLALKHMHEAMECHPRISAKMIEEVERKAEEIREMWDQLPSINIDSTQRQAFQMILEGDKPKPS